MGLSISHEAWRGAYGAFHRWRKYIASLENVPLELMEGFWEGMPLELMKGLWGGEFLPDVINMLPLKWSVLKPNPLHKLLSHSDCGGYIHWRLLERIYKRLEILIKKIPDDLDFGGHIGNVRGKTQAFIDGCKKAFKAKQHLMFR